MKILYAILPLIILSLNVSSQTIPLPHRVDWTHAGYIDTVPYPTLSVDVTTFGAIGDGITDNHTAIVNAINSLNGNSGIVFFPPGQYLIASTLSLPDSVVLKGAGADSTFLLFNFSGASGININITHSQPAVFTSVLAGYQKESNAIVVDTVMLSVNDYAEIIEDNGAWDTQPVSWANNFVGQIIRVTAISGDTIFFSHPLRIDLDSTLNVRVRKIIPKTNVGIECLNIARVDSTSSGLSTGIYFSYAANCWIRGVESSKSIGSHIEADFCTNLEIAGSYIHNAYLYDGTSTRGYGITLFQHTGECKLENNIMRHLRHAVSLQCGANGNVIAYNYIIEPTRSEVPANAGADISPHGHYSFANLIEGNIVSNIQIDQTWGPSGPYNTLYRNRIDLYGLIMSSGTVQSDNQNFVGNEIPNTGLFLGNYLLTGTGHFEYGNNVRGTITPAGTTALVDSSYYLSSVPSFWNIPGNFPSIGEPNVPGSGSIPAKERFLSGNNFAFCDAQIISSVLPKENIENDFEIFPNPAKALIELKIYSDNGGEAEMQIKDITGREIYSEEIYFVKGENNKKIFISENSQSGLYFLSVKKRDSEERVKLFMISK